MSDVHTHCVFQLPVLQALDGVVFRMTEGDHLPALAITLDDAEAVIPLEAVSKLFGIKRDSPDGALLLLIGQALRFTPVLRLGDKLPSEVVTGEASWQPDPYHRQVATARLQMQLLNWIGGNGDERQITPQMLVASIDDPAIRPRVKTALRTAAAELGVSGGPAVAALLEELAVELSYVEALRERLFDRVQNFARRLHRAGQELVQPGAARRETLVQVTRLAAAGFLQIAARFEQVDAQTGEILPALRNLDQQRTFLRPHRDWLYTTLIEWQPVLREWDNEAGVPDEERLWRMLDRAYRFLAPRFMAVQEWQAAAPPRPEKSKNLVW